MSATAWLLIFGSIFVGRQAIRGRILDIGQDSADAFTAIVNGDADALGEVLSRTGTSATLSNDAAPFSDPIGTIAGLVVGQVDILNWAIKLGTAAKGYRFTATGPDYYDCSGLVWQACRQAGAYSGPRFTTFTIGSLKAFQPGSGIVGDIVVWPTHHMGVVSGEDMFYSAMSVRSGIGYSRISTFRKGTPIYLRPTAQIKVSGDTTGTKSD